MNGYALLDFGDGKRLEQWGEYRLIRPDPTASNPPHFPEAWKSYDAMYVGEKGKGEWQKTSDIPEHWPVVFGDLTLYARLAPYKHTGVFPEQWENWQQARAVAGKAARPLSVLNLFAYTGGATIALAKDGHFITHVDASKPSISWAKENALLSGIPQDRIRWILDDASTFVAREVKRGKKYDAILVDPPAYGHGGAGKTWRIERDLKPLLEQCSVLLSDSPAFMYLNGYAHHDTAEDFRRLLAGILLARSQHKRFHIEGSDLALRTEDQRVLSTGIVVRCTFVH